MYKILCLIALVLAAQCKIGTLIPPPDKISADNAKCLIGAKHEFIIIRGSQVSGKADPAVVSNAAVAKAAGFADIDLFFSPCIPCDPKDQSTEFINAIKAVTYAKIWIVIGVPGWREFKAFNQAYLEELIGYLTKTGKKVGILSSKFQWEDTFGPSYSGAAKLDLMYESLNKDASFKDYKPFGGWKTPVAKHYESGASVCTFKMEMVFKP
jgi:hypothetical protein